MAETDTGNEGFLEKAESAANSTLNFLGAREGDSLGAKTVGVGAYFVGGPITMAVLGGIDTVATVVFHTEPPVYKGVTYLYESIMGKPDEPPTPEELNTIADQTRHTAAQDGTIVATPTDKIMPESDYGRDAKLKIDLVQDHLAGKEMEIGRFYLKQRKYVAAINRFQTVVKGYERTSQVMEALYRLVESYLSLGLLDEAKKNAAVLGHNYPESKWYKYAYRLIEEGENSPVPLKSRNWFNDLLEFDSPSTGELPRNNEADSWMDQISDWF